MRMTSYTLCYIVVFTLINNAVQSQKIFIVVLIKVLFTAYAAVFKG